MSVQVALQVLSKTNKYKLIREPSHEVGHRDLVEHLEYTGSYHPLLREELARYRSERHIVEQLKYKGSHRPHWNRELTYSRLERNGIYTGQAHHQSPCFRVFR